MHLISKDYTLMINEKAILNTVFRGGVFARICHWMESIGKY